MKSVQSAKFLAFFYFLIVALVLVGIHVSVFWKTKEDIEQLYGQSRLDQIKHHASEMLSEIDVGDDPGIRIEPHGLAGMGGGTEIVFDYRLLPEWLPGPESLKIDKGVEAVSKDTDEAYFLMKTVLPTAAGPREAILLMDFTLYEQSESRLLASHFRQIVVSILILLIMLAAMVFFFDRLITPISRFAKTLAAKPTGNFDPVTVPAGNRSQELAEMVETFNRYLERIRSLLERERSFSRYVSHELRTPLTVMRGALTLMEESSTPEQVARQRKQLADAVNEMTEVIATLLNLTTALDEQEMASRTLSRDELEDIVREHEPLLIEKDLTWRVSIEGEPAIRMPTATLRILLGNLVQNAFAYAQKGEVAIEAMPGRIVVSDSGGGDDGADEPRPGGHGLGLLLVRDICHRFGWRMTQFMNERGGWTTLLTFSEQHAP